jgi:hypothetical protein
LTSFQLIEVDVSAHSKTRNWLTLLWLPMYMTAPGPRQSLMEPLSVVVHER